MRHFIFEFITGGGLSGQALPPSLAREGELMVQALVADLHKLEKIELTQFRDSRLPNSQNDVSVIKIANKECESVFKHIQPEDYLWLIAPESDNILSEWVSICEKNRINLFLSKSNCIETCSNKKLSNEILEKAGVSVVPIINTNTDFQNCSEGFIVKPKFGAGAEKVFYVEDKGSIFYKREEFGVNEFIVQPYLSGEHLSLSMLCANGKATLLACNKQYLEIVEGQIKLTALGVNEYASDCIDLIRVAKNIATVFPDLFGYIGGLYDFMLFIGF